MISPCRYGLPSGLRWEQGGGTRERAQQLERRRGEALERRPDREAVAGVGDRRPQALPERHSPEALVGLEPAVHRAGHGQSGGRAAEVDRRARVRLAVGRRGRAAAGVEHVLLAGRRVVQEPRRRRRPLPSCGGRRRPARRSRPPSRRPRCRRAATRPARPPRRAHERRGHGRVGRDERAAMAHARAASAAECLEGVQRLEEAGHRRPSRPAPIWPIPGSRCAIPVVISGSVPVSSTLRTSIPSGSR